MFGCTSSLQPLTKLNHRVLLHLQLNLLLPADGLSVVSGKGLSPLPTAFIYAAILLFTPKFLHLPISIQFLVKSSTDKKDVFFCRIT